MVEALPVLPSVLGGGTLAAVIFYLLRHLAGMYKQLGEAQSAASVAANDRAARVEAELKAAQIEIADLRAVLRDNEADWARRASAERELRKAHPGEITTYRWVQKRIDEIVAGVDSDA